MGNNTKRIEVVDSQTGEVFGINAEMMVSDIRDTFLSRRRTQIMAATWSSLSENDQRDEITAATTFAEDLVKAIVDLVASAGHEVIHAKLDNFKIKDGAVTLTAKGAADDGALLALNHVGHKNLKIVVADAEAFDKQREDLHPDPDQPDMLPEDVGEVQGDDKKTNDQLYAIAADVVEREQKCSISFIQRRLSIGYNRAAKLAEMLEENGLISAQDATGFRKVIVGNMDEPDDLHAEADQDEPVPDPSTDEMVEGHHARMLGAPSQDNPYDIDTKGREEWYLGWKEADANPEAPEVDAPAEKLADQDAESGVDEKAPGLDIPKTGKETFPDDPETSDDAVDLGGLSPKEHGQQSRLKDVGPDDNPFDGGTGEYLEWAAGYDAADTEVKSLIEDGYNAGFGGDDKKVCPWKKGTDGERYWLQGWENGKAGS